MAQLEVCVDSAQGLAVCIAEDVKRIELCGGLDVGGLTPSAGFIKLAARAPLQVRVLIRPRPGNFFASANELALMCDDIDFVADSGLSGVVFGIASTEGGLDTKALSRLTRRAGSLHKTLHRVIDTLENPLNAMEQAIDLGFDTILTSGGKPSVGDGVNLLNRLNTQANGRIEIMAGAGLTPSMVYSINQQTDICSFHSSCTNVEAEDSTLMSLGFSTAKKRYTDSQLIKEYHLALQSLRKSD